MIRTDREYEKLYQKYLHALAKARTVQEAFKERQEAWKALQRETETTEGLARELCETILSKDRGRLVLGCNPPADDDIQKLLRDAMDSYRSYCLKKTETELTAINRVNELRDEIRRLKAGTETVSR